MDTLKAERRAQLSAKIIPLQARLEAAQENIKYKGQLWLKTEVDDLQSRLNVLRDEYFENIEHEQ